MVGTCYLHTFPYKFESLGISCRGIAANIKTDKNNFIISNNINVSYKISLARLNEKAKLNEDYNC